MVFLPGNFGGKNDGDTQEVRIKIIAGCALVFMRVTIILILTGGFYCILEVWDIIIQDRRQTKWLSR